MVKDTSIDAYNGLKKEKKLNKQQALIMEYFKQGEIRTRQEVAAISGLNINAVCGRVHELFGKSILMETKRVRCGMTGKVVWGIQNKEWVESHHE